MWPSAQATRRISRTNVVQPFMTQQFGLYASTGYVEKYGPLKGVGDIPNHRFVGNDDENSRAPFARWLREHAPKEAISFRCTNGSTMQQAVHAGAGIGFMAAWEGRQQPDLVEMMAPMPDWAGALWLVTHVDLHRTTKVQAFLTFLKEQAKGWQL